jgi:hypothetical protein
MQVTVMPNATDLENFLAPYPSEVRELALATRDLLTDALPGAAETIDPSVKLFGYGYGPGYKGLVCTLLLSKTGVKIGIAHSSEFPDPKHLMQGSGKVHRYVQLQTIGDLKLPSPFRLPATARSAGTPAAARARAIPTCS